MFIQTDFHMENQMQGNCEEDWYMNKLSGSRVIKILNSANERHVKVRLLEDITMQLKKKRGNKVKLDHAQYTWNEHEYVSSPKEETKPQASTWLDGVMEDSLPEACNTESGSLEQCLSSRQACIQMSDDDFDIENMTIKEMQHYLKKATRKSIKSQILSNANVPSTNSKHCPSESLTPIDAFELQLDSSVSNNADSISDARGNVTTDSKPGTFDILASEVGDVEGSVPKGREPNCEIFAGVSSDVEVTEDEWTLEMWQSHHKQHSRKRKFKAINSSVYQNPLEGVQNGSVPLTCSFNKNPACNWQMGSTEDSPTLLMVPLMCASPEDLGIQGSPTLEVQDSGSHELQDGDDLAPENLPSDPISTPVLGNSQDCKENSSLVHGAFLAVTTVKLVLEDESESGGCKALSLDKPQGENKIMGTWAHIPCHNTQLSSSCKVAGAGLGILSKLTVKHGLNNACDQDQSNLNHGGSSISGQDPGNIVSTESNAGSKKMEPGSIKNPGDTLSTESNVRSEKFKAGSIKNDIPNAVSEISGSATGVANGIAEPVKSAKDLLSGGHNSAQYTNHIVKHQGKPVRSDGKKDPTFSSNAEFVANSSEVVEQTVGNSGTNHDVKDDVPEVLESLLASEVLDVEEDRRLAQQKPATLSCKRKAISPSSQEKLLQASHFGCGFNDLENHKGLRGSKRLSRYFKSYVRQDNLNREWGYASLGKQNFNGEHSYESSSPTENVGQREALLGSPCHNKDLSHIWQKAPLSKPLLSKRIVAAVAPSQHSPLHAQSGSLVPSPPAQQISHGTPPVGLSPVMPARGILRSASQSCCKCEDCMSVRSRAEKASEFAQRQMHDIEGLAVRLMKELGTMRGIVEEKLLQGPRSQSPYSGPSLEQVKQATNSATETEEMTKKWLARMARDCNRYCKIMRIQQRRLTFADESGGQLCQIRVFHSQADSETVISTAKHNEAIPGESLVGCNSAQDDEL